jgi:hypothetical protein
MIEGARQFTMTVRNNGMNPEIVCLHRSAIGIEAEHAIKEYGAPALILTSPLAGSGAP